MARTSTKPTATAKSVSESSTVQESAATVVAPVVAAAAAPAAAKKAPKAKAVKTETAAPAAVAPAPVTASAPADAEESAVEASLNEQSIEFIAKLHQLGVIISSLKTEYRALEKKWSRELKTSQKTNKRKKRSGNRAPSGFVKPTKISNELAAFLEKPEGTEMARTAVTKDINQYIRTNSLQDKSNGRKIIPDAKLAALLKLESTDELTYFNLQKFMSPHFAKNVKTETVVAAL